MDEEELSASQPEEPLEGHRRERRGDTLLLAAAVLVVILLVLLFWRGCSSQTIRINDVGAGRGRIVAVPKLPADRQTIAIWVKAGADAGTVLRRHGISSAGAQDMGDGTFIVVVPEGANIGPLVARLKADPQILDAGNVFLDDRQAPVPAVAPTAPGASAPVSPTPGASAPATADGVSPIAP